VVMWTPDCRQLQDYGSVDSAGSHSRRTYSRLTNKLLTPLPLDQLATGTHPGRFLNQPRERDNAGVDRVDEDSLHGSGDNC
jgi:hypothetical protein